LLARFYRNPARFLLGERLGIALARQADELDDDEPFVPDYDERVALADRLLPALVAGQPQEAIVELARAGREYPPGTLGTQALERELARLDAFARDYATDIAAPLVPATGGSVECMLEGERWRLAIEFADLRASGLIRQRYADAQPNDYVAGWIAHLALNVLRPAGVTPQTTWHSRDGRFVLRPLASADEAREHLQTLLRHYREGLRSPLHFFPKAAWAYCKSDGRMAEARKKWIGSPEFGGERDDPGYRLALRGIDDPLDADFIALADEILSPLLAHLHDPRLVA